MQFRGTPTDIVNNVSFLLSYLTTLYLLDFIDSRKSIISRLLTHRNPEDFKVSSSKPPTSNEPQRQEEIKFIFQPELSQLFDFKLFLRVQYPNSEHISHKQYCEISLAFTDFFDCYVHPSYTYRLRRMDALPTLASQNPSFRAIGCNPYQFRNLLDIVKNNQVWIPMRLHELVYLQLQFFPQKPYQAKELDHRTCLPQILEFAQKTHTNQNDLDKLLREVRVKFWIPLQHVRYETILDANNGANDASGSRQG